MQDEQVGKLKDVQDVNLVQDGDWESDTTVIYKINNDTKHRSKHK